MFLNSHNVNSNQNHTNNASPHRSRKEKLICRSIVTSEPVPPPPVDVVNEPSLSNNHGPAYLDQGQMTTLNNVNDLLSKQKSPGQPTVSQIVKVKTPRKSKINTEPTTNGTAIYVSVPISNSPKLPKRIRTESDSSSNLFNPNTNGFVSNSLNTTFKQRKEKKPKPPESDRPKRKYTKRKKVEMSPFSLDGEQKTSFPQSVDIHSPSTVFSIPYLNFHHKVNQRNSLPSDKLWPIPFGYLQSTKPRKWDSNRERGGTQPGSKSKEQGGKNRNELRDMRVPNSNTHLLLNPHTLKRMLRSPSPATQTSSLTFSEEELDEEIIQASNSLFKDMSLNRQQKAPSPTGSSRTSSSTSTTSSTPTGRGRYSRRKFGRLYPPFDPNHCVHPHCIENTLTGSKYCESHANGHHVKLSSPFFAHCTYTDPFSLKPCKRTVYGEDEREFRFCDAHAARVAATRLRTRRSHRKEQKEETMDTLMDELVECIGSDEEHSSPLSPATLSSPASTSSSTPLTPTPEENHDTNPVPLPSPSGNENNRDELSKEFNAEIDASLPHQSRNLRYFSRFQADNESDEDVSENDGLDPLKNAGYYSTAEVISIYRSKLTRLRSMYKSQFSVLKNAYMEYKIRYIQEKDKNELKRFTYTSDPKYIAVHNPDLPGDYTEEQEELREKSLFLMKYRHRYGACSAVRQQGRQEYEKQKTEEKSKQQKVEDDEVLISGETDSEEEYENGNPYQFHLTLARTEALKQKERSTANQLTSETLESVKSSAGSIPAGNTSKLCGFGSDSTRCFNVPLPRSLFCKHHILEDKEQFLFTPCARTLNDGKDVCTNPMIKGIQRTGCKLHRLAQVTEPKISEDDIMKMKNDMAEFMLADSDEEQTVLEELISKETFSMDHFDRSVKYLIDKGFTLPDTDESDSGNEEENEEMEMELADYRQKPLNEIRDESPSPVPPQVQSPCSDFKDENAEPLELSLVLNADQGPQEEVIVMPSDGNGYIDEQRSTNREISKKSAIRSKDTGRRKQVKFNKKVDVQSPETSERMRLEAARIISVQKFEREQKLVSLVYRESGKVKIQSEQNYNHPNFPFPPDYKRIDFDHIDPYKLFQAAEYLRQEQERFQEPFKLHAKKMWMLGKKADEVCANEERFLESLPSNPLPKVKPKTLPFFPAPPYSHVYKKEIRRHRKLDPNISTSGISLFAKMEGKKPKGFPGYYPKPTDLPPQFQPHPRPHSLAMRNVALWLKSNFLMKPVPLLHSSAFPDSDPAPRPSVMSNISPPLTIYPDPLPDPSAIKEIYIINGLIQPPNIFTTTVGNSFDEEYDKSPFKDIWNTAPWTPHCFRYVPHIHDFEDNEISLFFHRPFIMIVGESPRTQTRSGRRVEETIEIPDSVQLKNLRFYRLRDGKIVIEESARRKVSTLPW